MSGQAMDIAVISLADAEARRASVRAQMRHAGLGFRFSDAVGNPEEAIEIVGPCDEERFLLNTGRWPLATELACYASHLTLWRQCSESGMPLLIMEDDFCLRPGFHEAAGVAAHFVRDAGFLRLQAERRAASRPVTSRGRFTLVRYRKMTQGAMCYAISPRVAAAFLHATRGMSAPVDGFIRRYWEHGQPLYGLRPYTVDTADVAWPSQIGERHKAVKCPRTQLRRSWHRAAGWMQRYYFELSSAGLSGMANLPVIRARNRQSAGRRYSDS